MTEQLRERMERIIILPALIETVLQKMVAQRAERRKVERNIDNLEATLRIATLKTENYTALKNQTDRDAYIRTIFASSENWLALQNRFDQLQTAIEKTQAEREAFEHERKALKAVLEREYAAIIERVLSDQMLVNAIATHSPVMG